MVSQGREGAEAGGRGPTAGKPTDASALPQELPSEVTESNQGQAFTPFGDGSLPREGRGPSWGAAGGPLDNTSGPDAVWPVRGSGPCSAHHECVCYSNNRACKTGMGAS